MTDYGFEIHRQNISTKEKTCFENNKLSWFDANKQTSKLNSKYDGYFYYVAFYQDSPDDVSIDYTQYYRYDICGKCQYNDMTCLDTTNDEYYCESCWKMWDASQGVIEDEIKFLEDEIASQVQKLSTQQTYMNCWNGWRLQRSVK